MSAWRILAVAVGLAIVAGVTYLALRTPAVRVVMAPAERGRLQVAVEEEGRTRVRDRFTVAAPISGRLARIALEAGDGVDRGAVVARMAPLPLDPRARSEATARLDAAEAALREAKARVEQARAALEQAQRSAARSRRLGAAGTIPAEQREQAELAETERQKELEAALFAAHGAAFNREAARAALIGPGSADGEALVGACEADAAACIELRSPIHGSVLRVFEKSERVLSMGTPLLELGDPRALEIVVDVLSTDAVKVHAGDPMSVEDWGGGEARRARVRLVEPSGFTKVSALGVEEQRVNVIGDFLDDPQPLADGYRIEARIVVWEGADVLKIPATALFRHANKWNVFTVVDGRARRREIEVGQRSDTQAQVLGGLEPGDLVIVHPSDQVDEGVPVEPL